MNNSDKAISIRGLSKSFGSLRVLDNISLAIERGSMVALLGPNGAGKTTTVRILSTLLPPDEGDVRILGFDVMREARDVRRVIGLTGQYAAVDEILSGRENLEMMGRLYHLGPVSSRARARNLLEQFDLVDAAERPVKTYSGGMKRRLDLAASLVATPPVLFLDEPTTGLDPRSRLAMWDIITGLKRAGTTILLTTQYLEEADKLADRLAVLDNGRIIAEGTADELKSRVGNERVEIKLEKADDFDRATHLLSGEGMQSDSVHHTLSVPIDGSVRAVKQILDAFYEAGIELDTMSVHKPTLDDVFLHLTGRQATMSEEGPESSLETKQN